MRFVVLFALVSSLSACQDTLTESVDSKTCESGVRWTGGNEESPNMHPGGNCIDCHSKGEGPSFQIAGTVYDSLLQADECYGSQGAQVVITDAKGKVVTMNLTESGNFFTEGGLTMPYTAKVLRDGKESKMLSPQSNGDCNTCHTATGKDGAPGRVKAP